MTEENKNSISTNLIIGIIGSVIGGIIVYHLLKSKLQQPITLQSLQSLQPHFKY